jgi:CRISPR-associated protein Cmr3
MQIVIRPMDVWLFRDGKPFRAGEDHAAETLFPPSPFTLQGAIRPKVLADKGVNLAEFAKNGERNPDPDVGYGENFGKLRLRGPILMRCKDGKWERLIPIPADVVEVALICPSCGHRNPPKTERCKKCDQRLTRSKAEYGMISPCDLPFMTNSPEGLQILWAQKPERYEQAKGWLPESEWERYLRGQAPEQVVTSGKLFTFEPRFGIAIDADKGTTEEAMLYQARFVRLKKETALWAEVDGVSLNEGGFLRFGGEGRAAVYEALSQQESLRPLSQFNFASNSNRFKVVLVTPAWFSGGWQPKDGDWSKVFGASVQLVGAAIPRPLLLGGFDVAKGVPKPMRAFVPAGAVYFFEAEKSVSFADDFAFTETPDEVREQNDNANAWAQIGLGAVLIGVW